jgi:hypothetical protein
MSGLTGHGLRFDKKRLQRIPDKYIARKPSAAGIEYRYWNMPRNLMRDQGNTSSCVEHGFFHQALCGPKRVIPTFKQFSLYKRALQLDPFSGEDFEGGTTVEAGALAAREFGLLKEFHWTDSPDVAIAWLLAKGSLVLGTYWPDSLSQPHDKTGIVDILGGPASWDNIGHCWIAAGINKKTGLITGANSWGPNWGLDGFFKMRIADFVQLISEQGEVCMVVE